MKPMRLPDAREQAVPHRVYDLSIVDLEERRLRSLLFATGMEAANYLGIVPKDLYRLRVPPKAGKKGKTVLSPIHNKEFAVRIAKQEKK